MLALPHLVSGDGAALEGVLKLPHHTFPPLLKGTWLSRPNRFVVEVELETGERVKVHSNNTGTMRTCSTPGSTVYVSRATNPKRKLQYTLHVVESLGVLAGVDTSVPGKVFANAVKAEDLKPLSAYEFVASEVKTGPHTRLDALLRHKVTGVDAYVELKNVTLQEEGSFYFPDAVSARGAKHIEELMSLRKAGNDTFMVFMVQRTDGSRLYPADHIDYHFAEVFRRALFQGVRALAFQCEVSPEGVSVRGELPVLPADPRFFGQPGGSA